MGEIQSTGVSSAASRQSSTPSSRSSRDVAGTQTSATSPSVFTPYQQYQSEAFFYPAGVYPSNAVDSTSGQALNLMYAQKHQAAYPYTPDMQQQAEYGPMAAYGQYEDANYAPAPNVYWQQGPQRYMTHPHQAYSQSTSSRYLPSNAAYAQVDVPDYGDKPPLAQLYDEEGSPIYAPATATYPPPPFLHSAPNSPYASQYGLVPTIHYRAGLPQMHQAPQLPISSRANRPTNPMSSMPFAPHPSYTAQPLPELSRGYLAQANLHNAAYGKPQPLAHQYPEQQHKRRVQNSRSALPKPPPHSEHAMWCGNIPSDSSHAELWRFFNSRPSPASAGIQHDDSVDPEDAPDLHWTGVQSIHLIARSNCCFVNYASHAHLQQAMTASAGVSLRPNDSRCKPILCRVRKLDDDTKTGVGAQRASRIHQQWVKDKEEEARLAEETSNDITPQAGNPSTSTSDPNSESTSVPVTTPSTADTHRQNTLSSTASTTSSFLAKHFAKRYFILKSLTIEDLELSVAKGLWATQNHNEPVLDQAFRLAKEGVFLFFSANKGGEFFGVAKMDGPVFKEASQSISSKATDGTVNSTTSLLHQNMTIQEDSVFLSPAVPESSHSGSLPKSHLALFSSANELVSSPQPATPREQSASPELEKQSDKERFIKEARDKFNQHLHASDPTPARSSVETAPVEEESIAERRGATLDVEQLANVEGGIKELSVPRPRTDVPDDDGVFRRDTLLSPASQNARLEQIHDETGKVGHDLRQGSGSSVDLGWGRPFRITWISTKRVPFNQTRHIKNRFNQDRPCQISRDGTEVDPESGSALLELFLESTP